MRFGTLILLSLAVAINGRCQNESPFEFGPYTGPTIVYPGTRVSFQLSVYNAIAYDLLAAPTNVEIRTFFRYNPFGFDASIGWDTPSPAAVGSTNVFIVRATSGDVPPVYATGMVSLVVIDLPVIHSLTTSNGVTVLQFTNAFANPGQGFVEGQGFIVERAEALTPTHWSDLGYIVSSSPIITFIDTNPPTPQRFYRLRVNGWCHGADNCP